MTPKEKLIDSICNLVDGRINESFHINQETALTMISQYIDEYTSSILKMNDETYISSDISRSIYNE
jgi:ATP-dependent Zn protease